MIPSRSGPLADTTTLAVIGAGPVGLALALWAARSWPQAQVALFDVRPQAVDPARDPRVLALSLGSVQDLQRLNAWDAAAAQAITEVRVSQAAPAVAFLAQAPALRIQAAEEAVPMLGAVVAYGQVVERLQRAWDQAQACEPSRLFGHFDHAVSAMDARANGVDIRAGTVTLSATLAVVAEGGVYGAPSESALTRPVATIRADYAQTAWVGTITATGLDPGVALERFTADGPLALLPLPVKDGGAAQHSLVWCVRTDDDPVPGLTPAQRCTLLNERLRGTGVTVQTIGALKSFPLGLQAARTLVSGRVVRIGNAAQTLHPVAGQGLNLGLRDAYTLVQRLRDATDIDQALRSVEWQRASDRWSMILATDFLARSFTWRAPGVSSVRALALASLQALPPLRHALARHMMFGRR